MPMDSSQLKEKIAPLRERFIDRLPSELSQVARFHARAVDLRPDRDALRELIVIAHRLAGSGATFGFPRSAG